MNSSPDTNRVRAQLLVWWITWGTILAFLILIYVVLGLGRKPLAPELAARQVLTGLVGLAPLFVSIIIRWLVLPRSRNIRAAFLMFVVGLILAELCGLLGIFFGGPYRDELFVLGVLAVAQFVPFFARQFLEPRSTGFIPNN